MSIAEAVRQIFDGMSSGSIFSNVQLENCTKMILDNNNNNNNIKKDSVLKALRRWRSNQYRCLSSSDKYHSIYQKF